MLKTLAAEGISRLMVEGGPTVATSFVAADKVDAAALIYSDKLIGDDGIAPLEGMALDILTGRLHARGSEPLGADTLESYERKWMTKCAQEPARPREAGTRAACRRLCFCCAGFPLARE